jgi:hypothetical protein
MAPRHDPFARQTTAGQNMAIDQSRLLNSGIVILNGDAIRASEGTFVVLGAPRGGTSMVAGALHHLGLFMGHPLVPATYEDTALISAITHRKLDIVKKTINERNERYPIWGWKQPSHVQYFVENVVPLLRNPVFLVVYRDLVATANRNRIAVGADLVASMTATARLYDRITAFISTTTSGVMVLSYEKALNDGAGFVAALADIAGVTSESRRREATVFVQPSPAAYLARLQQPEASADEITGHLDQVRPGRVAGWAVVKEKGEPVRVSIYVNGKLVNVGLADRERPDILKHGLHPTGKCGFAIALPPEVVLQRGDEVRARVGTEKKDLNSSPWIYNGDGGRL